MTKDAYYFRHDSNASNDSKMIALRSVYGWKGIGWYWRIIEHLREQDQYRVTITDQYCYKVLAELLDTTRNKAETFIMACINDFKLLKSDGEYFWSERLVRDMAIYNEKCQKAKENISKRWDIPTNYGRITDVLPTNYKGNTTIPDHIISNIKDLPPPAPLPETPEQGLAGQVLAAEQVDYFLQTYPGIDLDYHLRIMIEDMQLKKEPIKDHFKLLKYRLEHSNGDYKKLPQPPKPSIGLRLGENIDPKRQPKTCPKCGELANPIIDKDGKRYYVCPYCGEQFD